LLSAVRAQSAAQRALVAGMRAGHALGTDPAGFHFWLTLPGPWTCSTFAGHKRSSGTGVIACDACATGGAAPDVVRVWPGRPAERAQGREAPDFMTHALGARPRRHPITCTLASRGRVGRKPYFHFLPVGCRRTPTWHGGTACPKRVAALTERS